VYAERNDLIDELGGGFIACNTNKKGEAPPDERIVQMPKPKYKCQACGKEYVRQAAGFYGSDSLLYIDNNGYMPICKKCANALYDTPHKAAGNNSKIRGKQQRNTDVFSFMDSRRDKVVAFIDLCLDELLRPGKLETAKASEITTAMGSVIDRFTRTAQSEQALQKVDDLICAISQAAEKKK